MNDEIKEILNYITNLQQENQELNDSVTWWNNRFNAVQRDYEDYKSRIEKAVEYINGTTFFGLRTGKTFLSKYLNDLLNILNGKE